MTTETTTYTGQEWTDLLRQMTPKEIRKMAKGAYRRTGKPMLAKLRESLLANGPKVQGNTSDWVKSIRQRNYPKGGGWMFTVMFHGKQGFHSNRFGKDKPVLMWAEDGTAERKKRARGFFVWRETPRTGKMKAYGFMKKVEPGLYDNAEHSLFVEYEKATYKAAAKAGFV